VNRIELKTLELYMLSATIPLVSVQTVDGNPTLLGTCTMIEAGKKLFLVTASHVLDENHDLTKMAIPTGPLKGALWTLGSCTRMVPTDDTLDVGLLEIQTEAVQGLLRAGWRPISFDLIDIPSSTGRFVLCGYPEERTIKTVEQLQGALLTVYSDRIAVPANAEQPVRPDLDLFLLYDHSAEDLYGNRRTLPALNGVSGSVLWEVREPQPGKIWAAHEVLKVVGITMRYRRGEYFRAQRWWLVAEALAQHSDDDVAAIGASIGDRISPAWFCRPPRAVTR
jgi:hypothetical protein